VDFFLPKREKNREMQKKVATKSGKNENKAYFYPDKGGLFLCVSIVTTVRRSKNEFDAFESLSLWGEGFEVGCVCSFLEFSISDFRKALMMRYLITGTTGLVGSYCARLLVEKGLRPLGLRRADSDMSLVADIAHQIDWVEGDLQDIVFLESLFEAGLDYVIHAAAIVSFAPNRRKQMWKTNVEGTRNLLNVALAYPPKKFCFISSVAALGYTPSLPDTHQANPPFLAIDERQPWDNGVYHTAYAISKHFAEREVWRAAAEGLSVVIVNPSFVLGLGDWQKGSSSIFKYAYEQNRFYPEGYANCVDVRDVAKAVVFLLESAIEGERFILNGAHLPYRELLEGIALRFGKRPPSHPLTPLLGSLAWRFEALRTFFSGEEPRITADLVRNTRKRHAYSSQKIEKLGFLFTPLAQTLQWAVQGYQKKYNLPKPKVATLQPQ
jgi:nucleoside-diphosphate-sugar epimerase